MISDGQISNHQDIATITSFATHSIHCKAIVFCVSHTHTQFHSAVNTINKAHNELSQPICFTPIMRCQWAASTQPICLHRPALRCLTEYRSSSAAHGFQLLAPHFGSNPIRPKSNKIKRLYWTRVYENLYADVAIAANGRYANSPNCERRERVYRAACHIDIGSHCWLANFICAGIEIANHASGISAQTTKTFHQLRFCFITQMLQQVKEIYFSIFMSLCFCVSQNIICIYGIFIVWRAHCSSLDELMAKKRALVLVRNDRGDGDVVLPCRACNEVVFAMA